MSAQNIFPSTGSAGIGTTAPNTSSALEIKSTTQGLLISRMTKAQRDAIISPAEGLMVYQTNYTPGFYYFTGTAWTAVSVKSKGWQLTGNSSTNPAINFIGTTDAVDFLLRTDNQERVRILSDGKIGIGTNAPVFRLDVKGSVNTDSLYRIGGNAVLSVNGISNLFVGAGSGFSNTTGQSNTATGSNALYENTTGYGNTATGVDALGRNTIGNVNTATGSNALYENTTGAGNTATGANALYENTTGTGNTATGDGALERNTIGTENTATAYYALHNNGTGNKNTAYGYSALWFNTEGHQNTAIGYNAGYNVITGSLNTFIGTNTKAGVSDISNSTAIGNGATVTGSNIFVFGNSNVVGWGFGVESGIRALKVGTTASNGNSAYLTVGGTWTNASARSKKEDFQRQDRNAILAKINQLEITKWKYKGTDNEYHYGPMADDFYRLFKVGDDSSISDMDKTGVLFLGMQALSKMNEDKDAKINELEARLAKLEAMMSAQSTANYKQPRLNDAVGQEAINLSSASLEQNTPNPFNNTTTINYTLPQTYSSAKIIVVDKAGKVLKEIDISGNSKGSLQVDAPILASGAYHYSLYVDGRLIDTKQMLIAK
jgi:hypothetical protein